MAPSKKVKKDNAPKQVLGQGLQKFFGGTRSTTVATTANDKVAHEEAKPTAVAAEANTPAAADSEGATTTKSSTPLPGVSETATTTVAAVAPEESRARTIVAISSGEPVDTTGRGAAPQSGGLTEAQQKRIEENRRKALERQQAKKNGGDAASKPSASSPNTSSDASLSQILSCAKSQQAKPKAVSGKAGQAKKGGDDAAKRDSEPTAKSKRKSDDDHVTPLKRSSAQLSKTDSADISPLKTASPFERRVIASEGAQAALQLRPQDKFSSFGKIAWIQYNSLYSARLESMRHLVVAHSRFKWSNDVGEQSFLPSIVANGNSTSSDVVVVGILFKDLKGRDNVIEKYQTSKVCGSMPEDEGYTQQDLSTESDVLWLEDHVSRIQLEISGEYLSKLATGFVVGVRGCYTNKGHLHVKDFCLAQNLISSSLPLAPVIEGKTSDSFVVLLSGLFIGAQDEDVEARSRLVDFLLGTCAQMVKRVIVCGGVYAVPTLGQVPPGLADADNLFAQLSEKLTVDLLPGRKDPTNLCMPQMPLHPYFFKTAKKTGNFKSVTNPYQCTLDDLNLVGHSGQPVQDLLRCTSFPTPLEALTASLDACLLAPTAPDTLGTQPFAEADPFVIEKTPQVLFSGGHAKLELDWRSSSPGGPGTLCVCVPAFHSQPSAIFVNLSNPRDVRVKHFGAQAA